MPEGKAEHPWVVGDAEGGSVASCEPMGPWMSGAEATANAHIIAAAPETYAALLGLTMLCAGRLPTEDLNGPEMNAAAAALRKARGEGEQ